MLHTHVLPGFGSSPNDLCPQCECERLVALGVPCEIAWRASRIRQLMDPTLVSPKLMAELQEELAELERKYGKKIP